MSISDVKKCIDDLEKKHRITSVESLWKAKRYKEVAKIIFFMRSSMNFYHLKSIKENFSNFLFYSLQLCSILSKDISFSRVSVDEMYRLVHIWMCSLYERKKFGKYLQLNIR